MKFSNKTYDILKFLVTIALPATGILYYALAEIWKLPLGKEITATLSGIAAFLGTLIGISSRQYNK